jgi:ABC-type transport system involved in multi-copper enzyme maturation permease subunit
MLRRELAIVLGARVTWLVAAVAALLIGHSFVLAVDLFGAGARSVEAGGLMAREFDPLLGIVRPTLGGVYISVSLLVPLVAARSLGIEKERRSLRVLLLHTAAPLRLLLSKYLAALAGGALILLSMLVSLLLWLGAGGHLALGETAVALLGHTLHLMLITAIACAAAAWTETVAQAAAVTLVGVLGSWAIDAAEGFAALAWLGGAAEWSITAHLGSFERGVLSFADTAWLLIACLGALTLAWSGLRFDWSFRRRWLTVIATLLVLFPLLRLAERTAGARDFTELQRASFPSEVISALRSMPESVSLTVMLDREDARRRQLELDVLSRLRLARSDLRVRYPLDEGRLSIAATRDDSYGRIEICAGTQCQHTYSTNRKELVALLFESAHIPSPDFAQRNYPGYPLVVEGGQRARILWLSYLFVPLALTVFGLWMTRRRKRK